MHICFGCIAVVWFRSSLLRPKSSAEANINGFKIHTVYIMGGPVQRVVWAYKAISLRETMLEPRPNDLQQG